MKLHFDFRPPESSPREPGSISVKVKDQWVEGNAIAHLKEDGSISVGIYVWSGAIGEAARLTLESLLQRKLKWTEYGGGNGYEGGTLKDI